MSSMGCSQIFLHTIYGVMSYLVMKSHTVPAALEPSGPTILFNNLLGNRETHSRIVKDSVTKVRHVITTLVICPLVQYLISIYIQLIADDRKHISQAKHLSKGCKVKLLSSITTGFNPVIIEVLNIGVQLSRYYLGTPDITNSYILIESSLLVSLSTHLFFQTSSIWSIRPARISLSRIVVLIVAV